MRGTVSSEARDALGETGAAEIGGQRRRQKQSISCALARVPEHHHRFLISFEQLARSAASQREGRRRGGPLGVSTILILTIKSSKKQACDGFE